MEREQCAELKLGTCIQTQATAAATETTATTIIAGGINSHNDENHPLMILIAPIVVIACIQQLNLPSNTSSSESNSKRKSPGLNYVFLVSFKENTLYFCKLCHKSMEQRKYYDKLPILTWFVICFLFIVEPTSSHFSAFN